MAQNYSHPGHFNGLPLPNHTISNANMAHMNLASQAVASSMRPSQPQASKAKPKSKKSRVDWGNDANEVLLLSIDSHCRNMDIRLPWPEILNDLAESQSTTSCSQVTLNTRLNQMRDRRAKQNLWVPAQSPKKQRRHNSGHTRGIAATLESFPDRVGSSRRKNATRDRGSSDDDYQPSVKNKRARYGGGGVSGRGGSRRGDSGRGRGGGTSNQSAFSGPSNPRADFNMGFNRNVAGGEAANQSAFSGFSDTRENFDGRFNRSVAGGEASNQLTFSGASRAHANFNAGFNPDVAGASHPQAFSSPMNYEQRSLGVGEYEGAGPPNRSGIVGSNNHPKVEPTDEQNYLPDMALLAEMKSFNQPTSSFGAQQQLAQDSNIGNATTPSLQMPESAEAGFMDLRGLSEPVVEESSLLAPMADNTEQSNPLQGTGMQGTFTPGASTQEEQRGSISSEQGSRPSQSSIMGSGAELFPHCEAPLHFEGLGGGPGPAILSAGLTSDEVNGMVRDPDGDVAPDVPSMGQSGADQLPTPISPSVEAMMALPPEELFRLSPGASTRLNDYFEHECGLVDWDGTGAEFAQDSVPEQTGQGEML